MGAKSSHIGESHAELLDDLTPQLGGDLDCNAKDLVLDITTGTKIGTATNQKLSFWNKTPVIQPLALTAIDATVIDSAYDATEEAVLNNVRTRLNEMESRLSDIGILP